MQTLSENNPSAFLTASKLLASGGVIVFPTETVYGIGTLWCNQAGQKRIYQLKKRPAEKRLQMLAASLEQAAAAGVVISDVLRQIAAAFWPGPLTVVAASEDGNSVGLRIPAHIFLLRLLEKLAEPMAATSANFSGQAPGANAKEAVQLLDGKPDLLIDGGKITATNGVASTVVSILDGQLRILRQGPVSLEQLQKCLQ